MDSEAPQRNLRLSHHKNKVLQKEMEENFTYSNLYKIVLDLYVSRPQLLKSGSPADCR